MTRQRSTNYKRQSYRRNPVSSRSWLGSELLQLKSWPAAGLPWQKPQSTHRHPRRGQHKSRAEMQVLLGSAQIVERLVNLLSLRAIAAHIVAMNPSFISCPRARRKTTVTKTRAKRAKRPGRQRKKNP